MNAPAWTRWLLAPLCTLAAASLFAFTHWPTGSYVPRSARVDRTPAATPSQAKRDGKQTRPKPRSAEQREALWSRFKGSDITHEAVHARFKKENLPSVKRGAALAKTAAFDGWPHAPELTLESGCKTIRCYVTFCSDDERAREAFAEAFSRVRYREAALWRGLEFEHADGGSEEGDAEPTFACERAVFGMTRRRPETKFVRMGEQQAQD